MNTNKITELQIQIIINNSLFEKGLIVEEMYSKANKQLLNALKKLQLS